MIQQQIVAGRPWSIEDMDTRLQGVWKQAMAQFEADGSISPQIYPGSIKMECSACAIDVAVGPRQQTMLRMSPKTTVVMCMLCAIVAMAEADQLDDIEGSIVSLNNPDDPNAGRRA